MHKLRAAAVVAIAMAIAACYSLNTSSTQEFVTLNGSGLTDNGGQMYSYDFGVQAMPTAPAMFQFVPGGDDYYIDSYSGSGACNQFPITASSPPLDGSSGSTHVYTDGSGTCLVGHLRGATPQDCNYPFGVGFIPQSGSAQCVYTIHFSNSTSLGSGNVLLTLNGSGNVSGITASPSQINLSAPQGQLSGAGSATVTKVGSGQAMGSAYIDDITHYQLMGPQPWMLNGQGSNQTYSVTCQSGSAGSFPSTLHFQPSTGSGAAMIPLTCDVTNTNGLMFSGSPVNFPMTLVGANATDQSVTAINNGGSQPISFALDAMATASNVTMSLTTPNPTTIGTGTTNGTQVMVTVHWTPTAAVSGKLGTLNVTYGSPTQIVFPVVINGQSGSGNVAVNPTSAEFGAVCIGTTVPPVQLDIYNSGGADVMLTTISPPASPFGVSPLFTNQNIVHMHGNDVKPSVTLAPAAEGELMDMVTLNLTGQAAVTVPVHATVVGQGVKTTPPMLAFGTTLVGGTSNRQTFALSNCDSADLTVQSAAITNDADGTPSNDYRVAMPSPIENTVIPMTKAQTIAMEMTPQSVGEKRATLTLTFTNGDMQTVALDGTGAGPGGSGSDYNPRQTYYACSTGTPSGAAPVALALLALRRRRKLRR